MSPLSAGEHRSGPELIEMDLSPKYRRGNGKQRERELIEAMEVSTKRPMFFPTPPNAERNAYTHRIRNMCANASRDTGRTKVWETRFVMSGVIPGVAVWRVK